MKRLMRKAEFDIKQLTDAHNKLKHYKKQYPDAVQNAENVLGMEYTHAYIIAIIVKYNGMEGDLENAINSFLYSGLLEPDIDAGAKELQSMNPDMLSIDQSNENDKGNEKEEDV